MLASQNPTYRLFMVSGIDGLLIFYLSPTDFYLQPTWEPSAVGYLRHDPKIYEAPVYITSQRGPTYVFLATLKTEDPVSKWTLTGTAVLLQTDE